jgi:hypothetical protein
MLVTDLVVVDVARGDRVPEANQRHRHRTLMASARF